MIGRTTLSAFTLMLALPLAHAQTPRATAKADNQSISSESVVEVSRSTTKNGKTEKRHYRRVVRNGKLVEESGDRSLSKKGGKPVELDAEKMLEKMRRELDTAKKAGTSTKSHTRRVVVIDGKTVVDEETVDGKPVPKSARRGAPPGQKAGKRKPGTAGKPASAGKKDKAGKSSGNRLKRVR